MARAVDQLSVYVVPGRTTQPADALAQAHDAESVGFGGVYVSERLDLKDAGVVCGAIGAVTTDLRFATGIIHQGTRHPLAIASMAATLQTMSGGRFVLGIGRGLGALSRSLGVTQPTLAALEHLASVLRRLWAGERLTEDGPAGSFRGLRFSDALEVVAPPILLGTVGPKGLALAGRAFDGAILHPFLTTKAVGDATAMVRRGAEEAGRDPATVRVVATLVAAPDLATSRADIAVRARAVSYFQVQGLGEQLVAWNEWDPGVLDRLRSHATLAGKGIADTALARQDLVASSSLLPEAWLADGAALGSSESCAQRASSYLAAGADEVLVHGAAPSECQAMVEAFRAT